MTSLNLPFCLLNPSLLILSLLDIAEKTTPFLLIAICLYLRLLSCLWSSLEKAPSYFEDEYAEKALCPMGQVIHLFFPR